MDTARHHVGKDTLRPAGIGLALVKVWHALTWRRVGRRAGLVPDSFDPGPRATWPVRALVARPRRRRLELLLHRANA